MREAIGATWIMGIVITFIALFSCFLAFSVNYSKAIGVKDSIIERLEKYDGANDDAFNDIANMLNEVGYYVTGNCRKLLGDSESEFVGINGTSKSNENANYCIQKIRAYNPKGQLDAAYYRVYVFFSLSIPVFDHFQIFTIKGETINIYFPREKQNLFN